MKTGKLNPEQYILVYKPILGLSRSFDELILFLFQYTLNV